jgi:hypothetical protein
MGNLRVLEGGRSRSTERDGPDCAGLGEFGAPTNLLFGVISASFGALGGVVSLVVFFELFSPYPYISTDWAVFVGIGAVIGYFLRIERPFLAIFGRLARGTYPSPQRGIHQ